MGVYLQGKFLEVGLSGQMVNAYAVWIIKFPSVRADLFSLLTAMCKKPYTPTSLAKEGLVKVSIFCLSDKGGTGILGRLSFLILLSVSLMRILSQGEERPRHNGFCELSVHVFLLFSI